MAKHIQLIGYASGNGAGNKGCSMGPVNLQDSEYLESSSLTYEWAPMLYNRMEGKKLEAMPGIIELSQRLAHITENLTTRNTSFAVIGGDHTSAIGTWSGASSALEDKGALGLIWIDAHMDSHTPATTPSQNIHGMPLAVLLGEGEHDLTHLLNKAPKLSPSDICLVGVRSFEPEEEALLERLNVRIFYMDEVKERGLDVVMQDALELVSKNTAGFGISLDLDGIDPLEAPGVGSPVNDGLKASELLRTFKGLANNKHFIGIDITEFNPHLDQDNKTEKIIVSVLQNIFGT